MTDEGSVIWVITPGITVKFWFTPGIADHTDPSVENAEEMKTVITGEPALGAKAIQKSVPALVTVCDIQKNGINSKKPVITMIFILAAVNNSSKLN